jgi:flagellar biosynthesis regulator FlbT
MSKSNNPLTNYFKRNEIVDDVEKIDKMMSESYGNKALFVERLKLDEFADSTTPTTTNSTTTSAIPETSTPSLLNERDPPYGPEKANE